MADSILPTDQFSTVLRGLHDNPGAIKAESTVHTRDFYGNTASWIVTTFRVDGQTWQFLQRNSAGESLREVIPPEVTAALIAHQDRIVSRTRRRAAHKAVATKRAAGIPIGNAEALRKARRKKR